MTDQRTSTGTADDRQYMGSAADAKAALVEKTRAWRETRQPSMATPREHREAEIREHQLRFEVANAAALWLWHEENLEPVTPAQAARPYFDGDLVNRQCKLGDYCKCCAGKPCLCPNYEGPGAIAQGQPEPLREALEFYADPTRYSGPNSRLTGEPDKYQPEGLYYRLDVTRDAGRIARRALALTSTERARGASSSDGSSRDPATPESSR